jgi:cyclopropane fatty-acyl-phospholipid synthase-like methyltransferase
MSMVIDEYFNGNFHFVPPLPGPEQEGTEGPDAAESMETSLRRLHTRIGECLGLEAGKHCVDIGCGLGSVMQDLAHTGATLTGITIADNEV